MVTIIDLDVNWNQKITVLVKEIIYILISLVEKGKN